MPALPASNPFSLRLFGRFELLVNARPAPRPRSQAGQAILAILALRRERPVERIWLAALLWPDSGHEQALFNLRRNLTDLRRILGSEAGRLASPTPRSLHLDLQGAHCDVTEFDARVKGADSAALETALSLYGGALLPECREDWVSAERSAREQSFLEALETLADRLLRAGRPPSAPARDAGSRLRVELGSAHATGTRPAGSPLRLLGLLDAAGGGGYLRGG